VDRGGRDQPLGDVRLKGVALADVLFDPPHAIGECLPTAVALERRFRARDGWLPDSGITVADGLGEFERSVAAALVGRLEDGIGRLLLALEVEAGVGVGIADPRTGRDPQRYIAIGGHLPGREPIVDRDLETGSPGRRRQQRRAGSRVRGPRRKRASRRPRRGRARRSFRGRADRSRAGPRVRRASATAPSRGFASRRRDRRSAGRRDRRRSTPAGLAAGRLEEGGAVTVACSPVGEKRIGDGHAGPRRGRGVRRSATTRRGPSPTHRVRGRERRRETNRASSRRADRSCPREEGWGNHHLAVSGHRIAPETDAANG